MGHVVVFLRLDLVDGYMQTSKACLKYLDMPSQSPAVPAPPEWEPSPDCLFIAGGGNPSPTEWRIFYLLRVDLVGGCIRTSTTRPYGMVSNLSVANELN